MNNSGFFFPHHLWTFLSYNFKDKRTNELVSYPGICATVLPSRSQPRSRRWQQQQELASSTRTGSPGMAGSSGQGETSAQPSPSRSFATNFSGAGVSARQAARQRLASSPELQELGTGRSVVQHPKRAPRLGNPAAPRLRRATWVQGLSRAALSRVPRGDAQGEAAPQASRVRLTSRPIAQGAPSQNVSKSLGSKPTRGFLPQAFPLLLLSPRGNLLCSHRC